jgi:hypothetical protein
MVPAFPSANTCWRKFEIDLPGHAFLKIEKACYHLEFVFHTAIEFPDENLLLPQRFLNRSKHLHPFRHFMDDENLVRVAFFGKKVIGNRIGLQYR